MLRLHSGCSILGTVPTLKEHWFGNCWIQYSTQTHEADFVFVFGKSFITLANTCLFCQLFTHFKISYCASGFAHFPLCSVNFEAVFPGMHRAWEAQTDMRTVWAVAGDPCHCLWSWTVVCLVLCFSELGAVILPTDFCKYSETGKGKAAIGGESRERKERKRRGVRKA